MKHYKLNPKPAAATPKTSTPTTRQEVDAMTKQIGKHIEKDPKKAAKVFESWLAGSSKTQSKKKAA